MPSKRLSAVILVLSFVFLLCSCGSKPAEVSPSQAAAKPSAGSYSDEDVDVDITEKMYVTYINEIYTNTPDYLGKVIRIEGMYTRETYDTAYYDYVYRVGPGCCGNDGSMCGFEFIPSDFVPQDNDWIRVTGVLEEYSEGESKYLHLVDTQVEVLDVRGAETVQN